MDERPRIGVTGPDRGGVVSWWFTWLALRRAGGTARRLRPKRFRGKEPKALEGLAGVVLGGGADVDPALYGEELQKRPPRRGRLRHRLTGVLVYLLRRLFRLRKPTRGDGARDEFETAVLELALERGLPVLGICRGAQLLAVHLGGRLAQDLTEFYTERPNPRSPLPTKTVRLEPGTRLRRILDADRCTVNALHSQAIVDPGPRLRVTAVEDNGVIQAVESIGREFLVGVQWHPEYLPQVARQQRLFKALVHHARPARP